MAMEGLMPSCNCKNTNCVKRYCACFVGFGFCTHACNCEGCWNREDRRTFVEEHAELKLNTKPRSFQTKNFTLTGEQRMHVKGCTCNKSGCKKNYCQCFKKQVGCTTRCKCQGCENNHGRGGKGLQENGDSGGSSGKPNGSSDGGDGSPGGSGESAVVTVEELLGPTEAGVAENVAAISDPGGIHFHQNARPQRNQGSVQAVVLHDNANSSVQGPSNRHMKHRRRQPERVPMQVEIDEADQLQNISNRYDCTSP